MNPQDPPFTHLTRHNIQHYLLRSLRPGGGTRPELLLLEDRGKRAVLKDYRASGWLLRSLVGPWLIAREAHIYQVLDRAPGVPGLICRLDRHALVVEHVNGRSCADYPDGSLPAEFFERLHRVVEGLHARGVVHCDIKNRSNIVVAEGLQPYIVDFAAAFTRAAPAGPPEPLAALRRFAFERFRTDDLRAVIKARLFVAQVGTRADAEFAFHRGRAERVVRALRDAGRWFFKLLAGG